MLRQITNEYFLAYSNRQEELVPGYGGGEHFVRVEVGVKWSKAHDQGKKSINEEVYQYDWDSCVVNGW